MCGSIPAKEGRDRLIAELECRAASCRSWLDPFDGLEPDELPEQYGRKLQDLVTYEWTIRALNFEGNT